MANRKPVYMIDFVLVMVAIWKYGDHYLVSYGARDEQNWELANNYNHNNVPLFVKTVVDMIRIWYAERQKKQ